MAAADEFQPDPEKSIEELLAELTSMREQIRDLTIKRLMDINQALQQFRVETVAEIEAGLIDAGILRIYDALAEAVAETAEHVSGLPENTNTGLGLDGLLAFMQTQCETTEDYDRFRAYQILMNQFRA